MGLGDWLRGLFRGPERKLRGKGVSGEESLKRMDAAYFRWHKKNDPQRWVEKMDRRQGGYQPTNPLTEYIKMQKELKAAGILSSNGKGGDRLDNLIDKLPEIVEKFGPALTGQMNHRLLPPADAAPAPRRRSRVADVPEDETEEIELTEENVIPIPPHMVITYVTSELANKSPREAAAWLLARTEAPARAMVAEIRQTTDANLFLKLDEHAASATDFAPLMEWFKQRGEWTVEVARLIRQTRVPGGKVAPGRKVRSI